MHYEVASLISGISIERRDDAFIHSTYEYSLKNVCNKYPEIAATLNGRNTISTWAVKACNTRKWEAAQLILTKSNRIILLYNFN